MAKSTRLAGDSRALATRRLAGAAGDRYQRRALARVYDYWLGGEDNFAPDRVAAEAAMREAATA